MDEIKNIIHINNIKRGVKEKWKKEQRKQSISKSWE